MLSPNLLFSTNRQLSESNNFSKTLVIYFKSGKGLKHIIFKEMISTSAHLRNFKQTGNELIIILPHGAYVSIFLHTHALDEASLRAIKLKKIGINSRTSDETRSNDTE